MTLNCSQVYNLTAKVSYYFSLFQISVMIGGLTLFNVIPLYEDYKMGAFAKPRPKNLSLDFAVIYSLPGYEQSDHFYFTSLLNVYFTYNCSVVIIGVDLLVFLMVFQIIGHIKTLMIDLETMRRPKLMVDVTREFPQQLGASVKAFAEVYDDEENEEIRVQLNNIVDHHRRIIGYVNARFCQLSVIEEK